MLSETEKAYLAGFFDGDGCVSISCSTPKHAATARHQLQVILVQCNREFLERWMHKTGLGQVYEHRWPNHKARKIAYHWRMTGHQAAVLLEILLPYLDIKKREAKVALAFQGTMGRGGRHSTPQAIINKREMFKQTLHDLKREKDMSQEEIDDLLCRTDLQMELFALS